MFGEKKNYTYLAILEMDIIKQVEMDEKLKKSSNSEEKTFRNQAQQQESNQSDKYLKCGSCMIHSWKGKTSTNESFDYES